MKYPEALLPNIAFKEINSSIPEYFICRTTPSKGFKNSSNKIPDEELYKEPKELFDFSTNLIGHFELDHNYIELCGDKKKDFYALWDFIEKVKVPEFKTDFLINASRGYFFLKIGDIHGVIKCPYNKPKNILGDATAFIIHTPTRSNFWHFSIKWKDHEGKFINENMSNWKYLLINTIKAALNELSIEEPPKTQPLEPKIYQKS